MAQWCYPKLLASLISKIFASQWGKIACCLQSSWSVTQTAMFINARKCPLHIFMKNPVPWILHTSTPTQREEWQLMLTLWGHEMCTEASWGRKVLFVNLPKYWSCDLRQHSFAVKLSAQWIALQIADHIHYILRDANSRTVLDVAEKAQTIISWQRRYSKISAEFLRPFFVWFVWWLNNSASKI